MPVKQRPVPLFATLHGRAPPSCASAPSGNRHGSSQTAGSSQPFFLAGGSCQLERLAPPPGHSSKGRKSGTSRELGAAAAKHPPPSPQHICKTSGAHPGSHTAFVCRWEGNSQRDHVVLNTKLKRPRRYITNLNKSSLCVESRLNAMYYHLNT